MAADESCRLVPPVAALELPYDAMRAKGGGCPCPRLYLDRPVCVCVCLSVRRDVGSCGEPTGPRTEGEQMNPCRLGVVPAVKLAVPEKPEW